MKIKRSQPCREVGGTFQAEGTPYAKALTFAFPEVRRSLLFSRQELRKQATACLYWSAGTCESGRGWHKLGRMGGRLPGFAESLKVRPGAWVFFEGKHKTTQKASAGRNMDECVFQKECWPTVCRGQERERGERQRGSCSGLGDRMGTGPLAPFTGEFTDVKQGVGGEKKAGEGSGQPS